MKNHLIRSLLVLATLLLVFLPVESLADSVSGDWQYTLNDEGRAVIVRYLGSQRDVELPWLLDRYMIAEIGEEAFAGNATLRSVKLPVTLFVIRMNAFKGCTQLEEVLLPELLSTIEDGAFAGCTALPKVNIPESVAEIGEDCFEPTTVLTGTENSLAEPYAQACGLQYEPIVVATAAPANTEADYQYRVENGGAVITSYIGNDYHVIIPAELGGYPVRTIGTNAFSSRYSIESVILPEGLITLERTAFRYCPALGSIQLPSTLETIGEYAFYLCENLEEIVIPDGVTELGSRAFQGCSQLKRVTMSANVQNIPFYTFFGCHSQLTICAPSGSVAERFAYTKGYHFEAQ